jgi:hypothetical protein
MAFPVVISRTGALSARQTRGWLAGGYVSRPAAAPRMPTSGHGKTGRHQVAPKATPPIGRSLAV